MSKLIATVSQKEDGGYTITTRVHLDSRLHPNLPDPANLLSFDVHESEVDDESSLVTRTENELLSGLHSPQRLLLNPHVAALAREVARCSLDSRKMVTRSRSTSRSRIESVAST